MGIKDFAEHDATGLAGLVRDRAVTPAELLEAAIARADAVNPRLNAITSRFDARARERIATEPLEGPFAGVPFLLKDFLMDYAGQPSTYGCRGLRDAPYVPERNGELVSRFLAAGAVPFGHTNASEFGFKAVTESEALGVCRNPWNLERSPAGSSGGSAAAVAAGIVPMAAASDGGGSIRIPASACGLFGLKPGRGRSPAGPDFAEWMHGGATANVVSRSVRDAAIMLDAIQGDEVGGPYPWPMPARPFAKEVGAAPGKLKIALCTTSPIGTPVHPECVKAAVDTARLLEDLGHHVEEAAPAIDGDALADDFLSVYFAMAGSAVAATKAQTGCGTDGFELDTLAAAAIGKALSAPEYIEIQGRWNTYSRALGEFFTRYDLYLTPTVASPPLRIGELDTPPLDRLATRAMMALNLGGLVLRSGYVHRMAREHLKHTPFTQLANLTGTPAMSVPLHWTEDGLPVGAHLNAAIGGEGLLIRLAAQLEQARPWAHRRPPVFAG
ncbi:MAG TPA: amidase family protein [Caulobacteraceae bacterium]